MFLFSPLDHCINGGTTTALVLVKSNRAPITLFASLNLQGLGTRDVTCAKLGLFYKRNVIGDIHFSFRSFAKCERIRVKTKGVRKNLFNSQHGLYPRKNEFSAGIPVISNAEIFSLLLLHVLANSNYA